MKEKKQRNWKQAFSFMLLGAILAIITLVSLTDFATAGLQTSGVVVGDYTANGVTGQVINNGDGTATIAITSGVNNVIAYGGLHSNFNKQQFMQLMVANGVAPEDYNMANFSLYDTIDNRADYLAQHFVKVATEEYFSLKKEEAKTNLVFDGALGG